MSERRRPNESKKPQEPLSKERVLRAAVALADKGGLATLSMRNLGQALGVEAMSLYNHVANKDEILDGMVEVAVGEIDLPAAGAVWKTAMRRRAISAHAALVRHPWASGLIVSRINIGPAMLRYVDSTLGVLRTAGFSYAMVDRAWNAMDSFIYGFTLQELNFPFQPDEYADVAADYLPQLPADEYPHLAELTKLVMGGEHDGVAEFEFGLDLILDGLERELGAGSS